jgi:hypothetical protein
MNSLNQFEDIDFGICTILYQKDELMQDVCLFASHTPLPSLPEYVYYFLRDIKKANFSIVFISSSPISKEDLIKLSSLTNIILEKENKGTDFGAWCAVLRWLNYGQDFETIYLCNDSVFGPFISFRDIHETFMCNKHEMMGITDSYQGAGYHLQSYFIGVKKNILASQAWKNFWREMKFQKEKKKVVEFYEIGLTQELLKAGFTSFIFSDWTKRIDYDSILDKVSQNKVLRKNWLNRVLIEKENYVSDVNPSSFIWKELIIYCNNPFLKRELFIYNHLYEEFAVSADWIQTLYKHTSYPVALIKEFLTQYFFWKSWQSFPDYADLQLCLSIYENKPTNLTPHESMWNKTSLSQSLLKLFKSDNDSREVSPSLSKLVQFGIEFFFLNIKNSKGEIFKSAVVYLDKSVVNLKMPDIQKLKHCLKEIEYLIIIVQDEPIKYIVSKIFGFKPGGIIVEENLFTPSYGSALAEELKHQYKLFLSGNHKLNLYNRPSLSDVVNDLLLKQNRTDFIKQPVNSNSHYFVSNNEEEEKLKIIQKPNDELMAVQKKYTELYENTPLWYKKLGHIIKLFKGNKKLVIKFTDKGTKDSYNPTAEDLAYWYYLQYEVLPKWYKDFGKKLIKKKILENEMSNMPN